MSARLRTLLINPMKTPTLFSNPAVAIPLGKRIAHRRQVEATRTRRSLRRELVRLCPRLGGRQP